MDEVRRAAYGIGDENGTAAGAPTRWQQFLFHAVDDQGQPVGDFTLEFFVHRRGRESGPGETRRGAPHGPRALTGRERRLSREAHRLMTSRFHTYSRDPSYRRILVDPTAVERLLPDGHVLAMRMYVPRVDDGIYYDTERVRDVVVHDPAAEDGGEAPSFFYPNTTTLVQLRVDRVTDYVTVSPEPRER